MRNAESRILKPPMPPPPTTTETFDISPPRQGNQQGKYVIAALVALGLVGASGGWLYHRQMQRRAVGLWGGEAAELIVSAPHVEAWRLEAGPSTNDADEVVSWRGSERKITARVDVTHSPGMPHLRHRLAQDASFDWSFAGDGENATWQYALRFFDGGKRATLLFDLDRQLVALAETGATGSIAPIGDALKTLLPGFFAGSPK